MTTFEDFGLDEGILEGIDMMGFKSPTPVQQEVIPVILANRDLIACAQTGTGKTAAFLLPLIHKVQQNKALRGVNTIIISPTRELALQIDQQLQGLCYFAQVSSIAVYGGSGGSEWDLERKALSEGADIIIATPGRLKSHLVHGYALLENLQHLVLDEADRMLDMGFIDDIRMIISKLPTSRQTLMFSATMPSDIRKLAHEILYDPIEITIALSKPVDGVMQAAYVLYETQKLPLVIHLLKNKNLPRILVFASTKADVKNLHIALRKAGLNTEAIHSDLTQPQREDVLNRFKASQVQILVATDVVSRGIDVQNIDLVINYNVPGDAEDYVHRIGRTARAQSSGVAITLINPDDQVKMGRIEQLIKSEVYKCQLPEGFDPGPEYIPYRARKTGGQKKNYGQHRNGNARKGNPGKRS
ncbi:MAG: DEAD/DEAH box helicase [Bacteroidales bacterium]|nr:DEAD/DEAH box helicase [Bacteroidales bacterium]MDD2323389.1 DEAD/DEAH box helicase [Bacteroidales bacterium]MDD3010804.1 DEAD/DEAH box helicase [Bacteroidales bacterium]MDD3961751.1 DEAD/DEAH box helicase [Bacteroidales bacterium]MDY0285121.1 DEAD/DEAH box helicase [Bacteroidales bacterium]